MQVLGFVASLVAIASGGSFGLWVASLANPERKAGK